MTRAVLVNFHQYQPFGAEFYAPILDFFLYSMKKYKDEYDHLYLLDSTWNIDPAKLEGLNATIIRTNPSMRYYDCFKEVLPQIAEDLVLLVDNDLVIYKPEVIDNTFTLLDLGDHSYDVVSIFDTIGEYKTDKLNGKNKLCPYWLATRKDLLMKYRDIEWGPTMPYAETLGLLTEAMVNDGLKIYEWEEDKSNILFDGTKDNEKSKDLGYMHIRAGSTPAYLLSEKKYGNVDTYWKYLKEQPKSEYLRQLMWFYYMCEQTNNLHKIGNELYYPIMEMVKDAELTEEQWHEYYKNFVIYHGLK